jgi:hypothetical protein
MARIEYYVALFHRRGDGLVAAAPTKSESMITAIGAAQHQAQEAAGAIAFGLSGTGDTQELEILFRTGDVPDGVPNFFPGASAG